MAAVRIVASHLTYLQAHLAEVWMGTDLLHLQGSALTERAGGGGVGALAFAFQRLDAPPQFCNLSRQSAQPLPCRYLIEELKNVRYAQHDVPPQLLVG